MTVLPFAYVTHEVRVVFGAGALASLPGELERAGLRRVLLITTPGRHLEHEQVARLLRGRANRDGVPFWAGEFSRARLHVPVEVVQDARRVVDEVRPEALLAFGGGSAIGVGKALAFEAGLPLAAIPTTYSGSEMTAIWGKSDGQVKRTFRDTVVAPRLVLYDPDLTLALPPAVSAASGMNALAHCVEAEYAPEAGPVTSWFALEGVRRLAVALPRVVATPADASARHDALFGAHLAGRALDMTSMGLHHKLAHIMGGSFGLDHAEAHAALLPWVTAWNTAGAPEAMARLAKALGVPDAAAGLAALARALGIRPLGALGFAVADIPKACTLALALAFPNPRPVTADGVQWILERAIAGFEA